LIVLVVEARNASWAWLARSASKSSPRAQLYPRPGALRHFSPLLPLESTATAAAAAAICRQLEDERDKYRAAHRLEAQRAQEMRVALSSWQRVAEKAGAPGAGPALAPGSSVTAAARAVESGPRARPSSARGPGVPTGRQHSMAAHVSVATLGSLTNR
jgi:hypothetical protein